MFNIAWWGPPDKKKEVSMNFQNSALLLALIGAILLAAEAVLSWVKKFRDRL
jgi:hypothetical protein